MNIFWYSFVQYLWSRIYSYIHLKKKITFVPNWATPPLVVRLREDSPPRAQSQTLMNLLTVANKSCELKLSADKIILWSSKCPSSIKARGISWKSLVSQFFPRERGFLIFINLCFNLCFLKVFTHTVKKNSDEGFSIVSYSTRHLKVKNLFEFEHFLLETTHLLKYIFIKNHYITDETIRDFDHKSYFQYSQ